MKYLLSLIGITLCFLYSGCTDDKVESKFGLSAESLVFYGNGGENVVTITANGAWTASGNVDWCVLDPAAGEGSGVLKVSVAKNTTGADREGNINIVANGEVLTVKLTQYRDAELLLSRSSLKVMSDAFNDTLVLVTSGDWVVKNGADWFHLSAMSGEAGETELQFSVDENDGLADRTAEIVFSVLNSEETVVLSVLQYSVNGSPQIRDSLALVKIYSLLDDPEHMLFNIWDPAKPFSSWLGVETKIIGGYTRVVRLNLAATVIRIGHSPWKDGAALPEEIGWLDELTDLDLTSVEVFGDLPASIGKLQKLKYMVLAGNNLTGKLPAEMSTLTQLRALDITSNGFTGDFPEYIGSFTELTDLKFGYNFFDRIPDRFSNLTKLETLEFPSSLKWTGDGVVDSSALADLKREFPGSLLALTNLKTLVIHDCHMMGALPDAIGNMSGLQTFSAYNNRFSGNIPTSFSRITNLVTLNLANNLLEGVIPASLGSCIWLYNIVLSDNRLTGGIPRELSNCTSLQTLELGNNRLSGSLPSELFETSHFIFIDISDNGFGGELPAGLGNQKDMETFMANNNEFSGIHTDISGAIKLSTLMLEGNKLESVPTGISYLAFLTTLNLGNNNITGAIPEFLSKLRRLLLLVLSGNKLSGAIPQWLIDQSHSNTVGFNFSYGICPQQNGVTLSNCPDFPFHGNSGGDGVDDGMGV